MRIFQLGIKETESFGASGFMPFECSLVRDKPIWNFHSWTHREGPKSRRRELLPVQAALSELCGFLGTVEKPPLS